MHYLSVQKKKSNKIYDKFSCFFKTFQTPEGFDFNDMFQSYGRQYDKLIVNSLQGLPKKERQFELGNYIFLVVVSALFKI